MYFWNLIICRGRWDLCIETRGALELSIEEEQISTQNFCIIILFLTHLQNSSTYYKMWLRGGETNNFEYKTGIQLKYFCSNKLATLLLCSCQTNRSKKSKLLIQNVNNLSCEVVAQSQRVVIRYISSERKSWRKVCAPKFCIVLYCYCSRDSQKAGQCTFVRSDKRRKGERAPRNRGSSEYQMPGKSV